MGSELPMFFVAHRLALFTHDLSEQGLLPHGLPSFSFHKSNTVA
jgi:hypothetical protein